MFSHIRKKHTATVTKYDVLEVRNDLQVCRADQLHAHSSLTSALEPNPDIIKEVMATALKTSDRLKKEKHYLELGMKVLCSEE